MQCDTRVADDCIFGRAQCTGAAKGAKEQSIEWLFWQTRIPDLVFLTDRVCKKCSEQPTGSKPFGGAMFVSISAARGCRLLRAAWEGARLV